MGEIVSKVSHKVRLFRLTTLRKRTTLIVGSLVLTLFGFGSTITPPLIGHARAAGCVYIKNAQNGGEIAGNGVNNPVSIVNTGFGNCFSLVESGTVNDNGIKTWYSYQNGSGHCLFWNGAQARLDVGGACHLDHNHPNEEMYGVSNNGVGWIWSNVANFEEGGGSFWAEVSPGCTIGSQVGLSVSQYDTPCYQWNFPS